jgi:hemerythrin-like domain-containing protein
MQLLDVLRSQHREVTGLLERIRTEEDRKIRKGLVTEVVAKLSAHMLAEEKTVYALAARTLDDEELVVESVEAHALVRHALAQLDGTPSTDRRLAARAKVIGDLLHQHIDEEENHLLPELEAHLDAATVAHATERFQKRFARAMDPLPPAPRRETSKRPPARGLAARRPKPRAASSAKAGGGARRAAPRGS